MDKGRPKRRQLFNEELKKEFLDLYPSSTKYNYEYVLSKSYDLENKWNKDLSVFNEEELNLLFSNMGAKSFLSISTQVSAISKYIQYTIVKDDHNKKRANYAEIPQFKGEKLNKYIDKEALNKTVITRQELYKIVDDCESAQDGVIFSLLFEIGKGEDFDELVNLKIQDVDEKKNILRLNSNNGSQRQIEVPQECIDVILEAAETNVYPKQSVNNLAFKGEQFDLVETKHILKPSKRKNADIKVTPQQLRQRFTKIKSIFEYDELTPTSTMISGMIDYADKIIKEKNLNWLESEHYKEITERYGMKPVNWYTTKTRIEKYIF